MARDTSSRTLSFLEDYLGVICELWQKVATEDMGRLASFVTDAEKRLSSSSYWKLTNELDRKGHKWETNATERRRADWKSSKESKTKGQSVKRDTIKGGREHTGTSQRRSYSSNSSSRHSGRHSRSANHHSSHSTMHNSKTRHNDRIDDDTKRSTVRNPSKMNASMSRPMRSGSMDTESRPRGGPNPSNADSGMRIECRISTRVSEERPSRSSDLSLLERNPDIRTTRKELIWREFDDAHNDMTPRDMNRQMDDTKDKLLPVDDSVRPDSINDFRTHWHRPFHVIEEGLSPRRNNISSSGSPSIDAPMVHEAAGRRVFGDIERKEDSATSKVSLQSERDPRLRKRLRGGSIDEAKRSRQEHLDPSTTSDRFDGSDNFDSNRNNDPHEGDLRTLIPKNNYNNMV